MSNSDEGHEFSHDQKTELGVTRGEYRILLPDNRWQIVSYEADEGGYRATVRYEAADDTVADDSPAPVADSHWGFQPSTSYPATQESKDSPLNLPAWKKPAPTKTTTARPAVTTTTRPIQKAPQPPATVENTRPDSALTKPARSQLPAIQFAEAIQPQVSNEPYSKEPDNPEIPQQSIQHGTVAAVPQNLQQSAQNVPGVQHGTVAAVPQNLQQSTQNVPGVQHGTVAAVPQNLQQGPHVSSFPQYPQVNPAFSTQYPVYPPPYPPPYSHQGALYPPVQPPPYPPPPGPVYSLAYAPPSPPYHTQYPPQFANAPIPGPYVQYVLDRPHSVHQQQQPNQQQQQQQQHQYQQQQKQQQQPVYNPQYTAQIDSNSRPFQASEQVYRPALDGGPIVHSAVSGVPPQARPTPPPPPPTPPPTPQTTPPTTPPTAPPRPPSTAPPTRPTLAPFTPPPTPKAPKPTAPASRPLQPFPWQQANRPALPPNYGLVSQVQTHITHPVPSASVAPDDSDSLDAIQWVPVFQVLNHQRPVQKAPTTQEPVWELEPQQVVVSPQYRPSVQQLNPPAPTARPQVYSESAQKLYALLSASSNNDAANKPAQREPLKPAFQVELTTERPLNPQKTYNPYGTHQLHIVAPTARPFRRPGSFDFFNPGKQPSPITPLNKPATFDFFNANKKPDPSPVLNKPTTFDFFNANKQPSSSPALSKPGTFDFFNADKQPDPSPAVSKPATFDFFSVNKQPDPSPALNKPGTVDFFSANQQPNTKLPAGPPSSPHFVAFTLEDTKSKPLKVDPVRPPYQAQTFYQPKQQQQVYTPTKPALPPNQYQPDQKSQYQFEKPTPEQTYESQQKDQKLFFRPSNLDYKPVFEPPEPQSKPYGPLKPEPKPYLETQKYETKPYELPPFGPRPHEPPKNEQSSIQEYPKYGTVYGQIAFGVEPQSESPANEQNPYQFPRKEKKPIQEPPRHETLYGSVGFESKPTPEPQGQQLKPYEPPNYNQNPYEPVQYAPRPYELKPIQEAAAKPTFDPPKPELKPYERPEPSPYETSPYEPPKKEQKPIKEHPKYSKPELKPYETTSYEQKPYEPIQYGPKPSEAPRNEQFRVQEPPRYEITYGTLDIPIKPTYEPVKPKPQPFESPKYEQKPYDTVHYRPIPYEPPRNEKPVLQRPPKYDTIYGTSDISAKPTYEPIKPEREPYEQPKYEQKPYEPSQYGPRPSEPPRNEGAVVQGPPTYTDTIYGTVDIPIKPTYEAVKPELKPYAPPKYEQKPYEQTKNEPTRNEPTNYETAFGIVKPEPKPYESPKYEQKPVQPIYETVHGNVEFQQKAPFEPVKLGYGPEELPRPTEKPFEPPKYESKPIYEETKPFYRPSESFGFEPLKPELAPVHSQVEPVTQPSYEPSKYTKIDPSRFTNQPVEYVTKATLLEAAQYVTTPSYGTETTESAAYTPPKFVSTPVYEVVDSAPVLEPLSDSFFKPGRRPPPNVYFQPADYGPDQLGSSKPPKRPVKVKPSVTADETGSPFVLPVPTLAAEEQQPPTQPPTQPPFVLDSFDLPPLTLEEIEALEGEAPTEAPEPATVFTFSTAPPTVPTTTTASPVPLYDKKQSPKKPFSFTPLGPFPRPASRPKPSAGVTTGHRRPHNLNFATAASDFGDRIQPLRKDSDDNDQLPVHFDLEGEAAVEPEPSRNANVFDEELEGVPPVEDVGASESQETPVHFPGEDVENSEPLLVLHNRGNPIPEMIAFAAEFDATGDVTDFTVAEQHRTSEPVFFTPFVTSAPTLEAEAPTEPTLPDEFIFFASRETTPATEATPAATTSPSTTTKTTTTTTTRAPKLQQRTTKSPRQRSKSPRIRRPTTPVTTPEPATTPVTIPAPAVLGEEPAPVTKTKTFSRRRPFSRLRVTVHRRNRTLKATPPDSSSKDAGAGFATLNNDGGTARRRNGTQRARFAQRVRFVQNSVEPVERRARTTDADTGDAFGFSSLREGAALETAATTGIVQTTPAPTSLDERPYLLKRVTSSEGLGQSTWASKAMIVIRTTVMIASDNRNHGISFGISQKEDFPVRAIVYSLVTNEFLRGSYWWCDPLPIHT